MGLVDLLVVVVARQCNYLVTPICHRIGIVFGANESL